MSSTSTVQPAIIDKTLAIAAKRFRAVAARCDSDLRTVVKLAAGEPVRGSAARRITRALAEP